MPGGIQAGKKPFLIGIIGFIGIVQLLEKEMFLIRNQFLQPFHGRHIVVQGILMVLPGKIVVNDQDQHGYDKKDEKNNKAIYIRYKMHFMKSLFFFLHSSPVCCLYCDLQSVIST